MRLGVRIKVSGVEDAVLRGMRRTLAGESDTFRVAWLHVTVMPGCECIDTIRTYVKEFERPGGVRMKSQEINDRNEWMLLFEAIDDVEADKPQDDGIGNGWLSYALR